MLPPPEILDEIFSLLATDHASLGACARAHPLFSLLVEPYLYADIIVQVSSTTTASNNDDQRGSFRIQELLSLLSERPCVLNYVRNFEICVQNPSAFQISSPDVDVVATILHMLARLTSITFSCPFPRPFWNTLPNTFRTALVACIRLPSMRVVCLSNVLYFPLNILDDLPHIKTIRLTSMGVLPDSRSDIPMYPSLQVLSLLNCEEMELSEIIPWAKKRQLRSLEFRPLKPLHLGKIIPLLQVSNSMTSLALDFRSFFQTTYFIHTGQVQDEDVIVPLYLADFKHLQRLTVHSQASFYDPTPPTRAMQYSWSLPAIGRFIESASSLKHVTLSFHISLRNFSSFSHLDWSPLDLHFPPPTLQHIDLYVTVTPINSILPIDNGNLPSVTILSLSRNTHLERLVEKGLLTINSRSWHLGNHDPE